MISLQPQNLDVKTNDATNAPKECEESTTHVRKLSGENKTGFQICLKWLERMDLDFYGV